MCNLINPIIAEGSTTGHRTAFTPDRMLARYATPTRLISCTIAIENERLLGFQSLKWVDPEQSDPLPASWGTIASFVAPESQGMGVGQRLWPETLKAALTAGVETIDATIRADNTPGLAYYSGLGFTDWNTREGLLSDGTPSKRICKRYDL
jgi:ribosomal protein S18 acetylase RimI-like enzyme